MARLPRLTLAGLPHYVVQRGNNLQSIFLDDQDYSLMQDLLREMCRRFGLDLHAYALLPNQLQLLITPETVEALPLMMQSVGRSYVRQFNNRHGRSGTLWEGRYRSTVLEAQSYLLPAMVVLEQQPVSAGLVAQPADYRWSSYGHNAGLRTDTLVRPHGLYWGLANTPFAREAAYARLMTEGVSAHLAEDVLQAALRGWVLGREAFVEQLQAESERRLTRRRAGRPPREAGRS